VISNEVGIKFTEIDGLREWGPTATVNGQVFHNETKEDFLQRIITWWKWNDCFDMVVVSHASPIAIITQLAFGEPICANGNFWGGVGNCRPRIITRVSELVGNR
jgi:hypothetical protein